MRPKEEEDSTTNRHVYNRRYKERHAGCSYCKWHRNENATHTDTVRKRNKTRRVKLKYRLD
jgi:hypothetical protein